MVIKYYIFQFKKYHNLVIIILEDLVKTNFGDFFYFVTNNLLFYSRTSLTRVSQG